MSPVENDEPMRPFDPKDVLIVFALQIEAKRAFDDRNIVFSGIGKVNAAYRLTQALAYWQRRKNKLPRLVLNLGSAGSNHFGKGSIVNCTRFVQRDFDVTALGHAPYLTPDEDLPVTLENGLRFSCFPEGVCGTGDNFATGGPRIDWNVVDMEAYALAKVCTYEKIAFGCLKYITDGGDDGAAESFAKNIADTSLLLREAADKIL
jgi:adenosylhomocysteine nucleosidase